jgi:hypothetical protein
MTQATMLKYKRETLLEGVAIQLLVITPLDDGRLQAFVDEEIPIQTKPQKLVTYGKKARVYCN